MTDSNRTDAGQTSSRTKPKRGHAATSGRILVAGLAAGSGLGLVGAMTAASRTSTPAATADPVRRVIVVDRTAQLGANPTTAPEGAQGPEAKATLASAPAALIAPEPAPLPLPPPPNSQPAPAATQSQGS